MNDDLDNLSLSVIDEVLPGISPIEERLYRLEQLVLALIPPGAERYSPAHLGATIADLRRRCSEKNIS